MNKDLRIFKNNEFGEIRITMVDDEPWFVGEDIVDRLNYDIGKNSYSKYIKRYVDEEDYKIHNKESQVQSGLKLDYKELGQRGGYLINESGLYSLVLSSDLPSAKEFKRWVTKEVLPSIRKHGAYMTDEVLHKTIQDPDYLIGVITALKDEQVARKQAEEKAKLEKDRRKLITHNNKTYNISEIAKELGLSSAQILNSWLHDKGVQYKSNGTWLLYSKYANKGYVEVKSKELDNHVVHYSKWTGEGRLFILELWNKEVERDNELTDLFG